MVGNAFYIDIKGWAMELISTHSVHLIFTVAWLILLLSSLRGVDRRDEIGHVTYAVIMMAIALVLFIGSHGHSLRSINPFTVMMLCALSLILAGVRWGLQRQQIAIEFDAQKDKSIS